MSKRPEKLKDYQSPFPYGVVRKYNEGWNQACDDWEKWLPSEEEIEQIISETRKKEKEFIRKKYIQKPGSCLTISSECLAKAITRRLRG